MPAVRNVAPPTATSECMLTNHDDCPVKLLPSDVQLSWYSPCLCWCHIPGLLPTRLAGYLSRG